MSEDKGITEEKVTCLACGGRGAMIEVYPHITKCKHCLGNGFFIRQKGDNLKENVKRCSICGETGCAYAKRRGEY